MDKDQLTFELHKLQLQATVEDALKTKENYRSTIRQLREYNISLEGQLSAKEVKVHLCNVHYKLSLSMLRTRRLGYCTVTCSCAVMSVQLYVYMYFSKPIRTLVLKKEKKHGM